MIFNLTSSNKKIIYNDTLDHYKNGLLRILNIDENSFKEWVEISSLSKKDNLLNKLSEGFLKLKNFNKKNNIENNNIIGPNNEQGNVWFSSIFENPSYGIASSDDIAWLIKDNQREITTPSYEEEYFEGDINSGGYSDYLAQEGWRIEKSRKQVKELIKITGLNFGTVLDIGSGYGYFRKALEENNFDHYGIEVSKHANFISKNKYNFDAFEGALSDYLNHNPIKFDAIMLGDVIEHIPDPIVFLKQINSILKIGGFVILKTPNIDCPEVKIFGPCYHSFKREHLIYFSPSSLKRYAEFSGFEVFFAKSNSHLLTGFVGEKQTNEWSESLKGSDLIFYLRKK